MLTYPEISPIALEIGPVVIRWYSLAYIIGIISGWWYAGRMNKRAKFMSAKQYDDILVWIVGGIVLGGRLGYVIFYNLPHFLQNPIEIFELWQGGMSFHGGMIGTILSIFIFCRKNKIKFFRVMDVAAAVSPIGLFLGRCANFINAELYGRPTSSPLGMIFPGSDGQPRHPSQLYEAGMEGILLFTILSILFWGFNQWKWPSRISGAFLIFYAIFRIIAECFREPDVQLGYLFEYVTMGQILCIPMILLGVYLIVTAKKRA